MKINRNKGSLQNQLAKMLQAGMENVDTEQKTENQGVATEQLRASEQPHNNNDVKASAPQQEQPAEEPVAREAAKENAKTATEQAPKPAKPAARATRTAARATATKRQPARQPEQAPQRLNAAQRHEVPDHNAKYAGEPIKSVGCRMPQSLYARMLQYKALNDSQLNRITLNDIIIEAVEEFMDENS